MSGSMSAKIGVAPVYRTADAVATQVTSGTITSSPGPIPSASNDRCIAPVQLLVGKANLAPTYSANSA